ncbi:MULTISPECIES: flagellar protein FlaG [Lysinibacillus]|uniref:Flagellar protein FlaG n=1 Tax=Lysinibacillus xylanilyticus TaxID=582475 RepID=A0ABV3VWW4_9BACI
MRIAPQGQSTDVVTASSNNSKLTETKNNANSVVKAQPMVQPAIEKTLVAGEEQEISKEKLEQAIKTVNEFLYINHNASKFVLHDGLDRYYVQVVDTQTEEVVKEIPPKKLLDAFYEMQKLLGMVVDEKI